MGALRQDWCLFHRSQCYLLDCFVGSLVRHYVRIARLLDNTVSVGPGALIWHQNRKKPKPYQVKLCRQMSVWQSLSQARSTVVPQGLQISKPGWVPRAVSLVRQVNSQRQGFSSRTSEAKPACWQPERLGSGQMWQAYPRAPMWHINQSYPQKRLQQSRNANFHCKKY